MKKIFFSALLAIVAVGGAMTASAVSYYSAQNTRYDCGTLGTPLCSSIEGPLYTEEGQGGDVIESPADFFQNNEKYVPQ